jgi:hypothetical protein
MHLHRRHHLDLDVFLGHLYPVYHLDRTAAVIMEAVSSLLLVPKSSFDCRGCNHWSQPTVIDRYRWRNPGYCPSTIVWTIEKLLTFI